MGIAAEMLGRPIEMQIEAAEGYFVVHGAVTRLQIRSAPFPFPWVSRAANNRTRSEGEGKKSRCQTGAAVDVDGGRRSAVAERFAVAARWPPPPMLVP